MQLWCFVSFVFSWGVTSFVLSQDINCLLSCLYPCMDIYNPQIISLFLLNKISFSTNQVCISIKSQNTSKDTVWNSKKTSFKTNSQYFCNVWSERRMAANSTLLVPLKIPIISTQITLEYKLHEADFGGSDMVQIWKTGFKHCHV